MKIFPILFLYLEGILSDFKEYVNIKRCFMVEVTKQAEENLVITL